jgi:hypothetical protein
MDTTASPESQPLESRPGVVKNPNGGYHIHLKLNKRGATASILAPRALMPPGTPVLTEMLVFEDCIVFTLQDGVGGTPPAIVVHVSNPEAVGSVVFFYHTDGILWRAVPLAQLNPGWVFGAYCFRGDLRKFDARLARMRTRLLRFACGVARPSKQTLPTFWATAGWQDAVVYVPWGLVQRIRDWQHSPLSEPQIAMPSDEQAERLSQARPADVQQLLAVREQCEGKVTFQIGGLNLLLSYVERIGLVEIVNRYCPRAGDISDGTVLAVLVINRLLSPRPLSRIEEWVKDTGLHLLLGIAEPEALNYDRLADALLAVYPHWQTIATEVTLRVVEVFQLRIDTIHYDLTSVFFHGEYEGSEWVTFGYSRDKRPDKRQVNIGISATDDGEVVLPGGSSIHSGKTHDGTTTVPTHERLHEIFQRSDLLVTGDSIMHNAENMLLISRAHGRFLGPTKRCPEPVEGMTPRIRRVVVACREDDFVTLPSSTDKVGHEVKATFRRLWFEAKLEMTPAEREREAARRRKLGISGRRPI